MEYLEDLRHEGAVAQLGQELGLTLGDGLGELGDEFQLVVGVGRGRGEALELQHRPQVVQQVGLPRHAHVRLESVQQSKLGSRFAFCNFICKFKCKLLHK